MYLLCLSGTVVRNRRISFFDPRLALDGCILPFKSNISHLGMSMDSFLQPRHMVEVRIRKFFGAVNVVLGQIGGVCRSDKVWLKIVDMKLFPVLAFGSHLWDYDRSDVSYMVNQAFRKGVRCGLGMRKYESIHDRLKDGFQEAMTRAKDMKLKYLQRAGQSVNYLVRGLFILAVDKKLHVGMV